MSALWDDLFEPLRSISGISVVWICCKAGTLWRMVRRGVQGRDFKTSGVRIHGFSWYVHWFHDIDHLRDSYTHQFFSWSLVILHVMRVRWWYTTSSCTNLGLSGCMFKSFIKVNGWLSRLILIPLGMKSKWRCKKKSSQSTYLSYYNENEH